MFLLGTEHIGRDLFTASSTPTGLSLEMAIVVLAIVNADRCRGRPSRRYLGSVSYHLMRFTVFP